MNKAQKFIADLFGIKAQTIGLNYQMVNGYVVGSPDNKTSYIDNSYSVNDVVYSIVNLVKEKVAVAQWEVYEIKDDSSLKLYKSLMSRRDITGDDYSRAIKLRRKALVPYENENEKIVQLLNYPNDYCTFSELVAESCIYKLITGDRFIWAELLKEGANTGKPQSLTLLPSQYINILVGNTFPVRPVGYQLSFQPTIYFSLESVMHDKFPNPNYSQTGSHLYGLGPLKAALSLNDRSNASNRAALASFQNQGAKGIVFTKDGKKIGTQSVNDIKNILSGREYRGMDATGKLVVAQGEMGYVSIGLSPVDLAIIESEKWDLRRFCNVFGGIPSQLLNDPENRSYNNQKEGEKALTTRGAVPLLNSFRDHFNLMLELYWGYQGKSLYVDYDSTCYSELQDDLKEKWSWVERLPVTNKYKLDLMALDYEEGQEGLDMILIPSGMQDISDLGMNETDNILNDFAANNNGQRKPVAAN